MDRYREITSKNKLTLADGVNEAEVQVRIIAKGSVAGKGNFSGTITKYYKVIRQSDNVIDLSKARITLYGKDYNSASKKNKKFGGIPFNGKPRKVTDKDPADSKPYGTVVVEYKVGKNYVTLTEGTDYELVYMNNVNKGKAVIIVRGLNKANGEGKSYIGNKRTTFSITSANLKTSLKQN